MTKEVLRKIELWADRPKKTFYVLRLERISECYLARKESDGNSRVFHRKAWFRESLDEAERFFLRILKQKTDPARKSGRKYHPIGSDALEV